MKIESTRMTISVTFHEILPFVLKGRVLVKMHKYDSTIAAMPAYVTLKSHIREKIGVTVWFIRP